MFLPNQPVVCINDVFPDGIARVYDQLPVQDWVYRIRDIVPASDYGKGETIAVLLREISNTPNEHGIENGFAHTRFRELTKQEMTLFKKARQKGRTPLPAH